MTRRLLLTLLVFYATKAASHRCCYALPNFAEAKYARLADAFKGQNLRAHNVPAKPSPEPELQLPVLPSLHRGCHLTQCLALAECSGV